MPKYRNHPIVRRIIDGLTKLNLFNISWSKDVLVSSLTGECQAKTEPDNVCIALHFNFDLEDEEYGEHMQVITIESCIKGGGTGLVSTIMECLPDDMTACVYDSTEGEAKSFWPKMVEKYPNIVRY